MAKINLSIDETLEDVRKALEEESKKQGKRNYLGMSQIGEDCWRKLFYSFRGCKNREIESSGLMAIQDGFVQEDIMAFRLQKLPYLELHTNTINKKIDSFGRTLFGDKETDQIGFSLLLDHFKGHADGMIKGIKAAPKTWHVWENKAVNETKFNKLEKLKSELGEKEALREWDIIYYAQAQIYMHCSNTERHYLTVQTPGGRNFISCRTDLDKNYANDLIDKAKSIIFDNWTTPAKIADKREYYKCKWCEFQGICHDGDFPEVNCKTCRYSEPVKDGERKCNYHDEIIKKEDYWKDTCKYHVYNPALIPAKLIEQQSDGCIYETENGINFANIYNVGMPELKGNLDSILPSKFLHDKIKNVNNLTKEALKIQDEFSGEIEKFTEEKAWDKMKGSGLEI
jgi:hypothetical protein